MKRALLFVVTLSLCAAGPLATAPAAQQAPTVSADLRVHAHTPHTHRVIVQGNDTALRTLHGGAFGVLRRDITGATVLEVTDAQLDALQHSSLAAHISGDVPVIAHTASTTVTNQVTGATTVWKGAPGLLGIGGTAAASGTGVTVAVVDSGIAPHTALANRVIAHVNFVSTEPGVTGDPFGHGTHVAGIIGGATTAATNVTPDYAGGSAPNVHFVDVRVLNSEGSGLTSDVIAGIDWVIANKALYKIAIINLSLGHPVTEPSAADPLCQAVARAFNAGITVVVSAGNYGETADGTPVLGGITSPGNAAEALTVGSIDDNATLSTADDVVAPYSSRGPTAYDFAVKPDVVAPGTRITSLEVTGSYLSRTYPQWHMGGSGTNSYLRLSGTSMSTAVVSGGAALLLSHQPRLTPAELKLAIQMGSHFMADGGLIGGGAGSVNFAQSEHVIDNSLLGALLTTVQSLLGQASGAAFRDRGTMIDGVYSGNGVHLIPLFNLLGLLTGADSAPFGTLQLLGTSNPLGSTGANYVVWGNVANWSNSYYVVWGNSIQSPSGEYVVWGNNTTTDANYVVWGNSLPGGH